MQAAHVLSEGGLIGLPTETVYGLAADALNPQAVSAIFQAKGRPANHPLIVHVVDAAQVALFAHGGVMDLLYRIATQQDLQAPRTWTLTNTAINRLLWTPQSVSLVGWADTSHLDESTRDEF